ncbi:MAG TPA: hypothetical protein VNP97_11975 [Microbacterium sp.]|nr:hypothetical protein [Microbacterium sp.]
MTTEGDDSTPKKSRPTAWLRAASDRVPTKWLAGIATAVFLAATAAFGGLATAAAPEVATLEAGEEHRNDQLAITVERAVLVDEFPEAGVYIEDGERVLAVVISVENQWSEPIVASASGSVAQSLQLEELAAAPPDSVARYDDATVSPTLQPGVPVQLVLVWAVDAGQFIDAQDLHFTVNDMALHTGSFVANGQWWTDPTEAATLTVTLDDIGAGA